MTQEQKDLLLKDLCARLPYCIKFPITVKNPITSEPIETTGTISDINRYGIVSFVWDYEGQEILEKHALHIKDVKPYLFPLSSMTEWQERELEELDPEFYTIINDNGAIECVMNNKTFDWFHKHHFDWRGLIPMGLANDATGLNIY